ncbi:hypothetical protein MPH_09513 [Macrophomina phaseolina MS6]|uniref:Cupin RmlC-type n=1 Tax=Macrophomina phaseolina (strain MS6) TaxID=1126212 RepID=K2RF41_MACPH|nr:hypothetical protein MPH_09513 [Macrophomina phaseolina MS6]
MKLLVLSCIEAIVTTALASPFSTSANANVRAYGGLEAEDCQIRCPLSTEPGQVVLPALTQYKNASGEWENTIECWQVDTVSTELPGIDNAFRLDWEGGFDAAYQYVFYDQSFMPAHPAPEPSLIVMSSGIGDLRVPSGRCLRVGAGDIFFSVGTDGRQTAWWSEGTVVSDFYFKGGKIPKHDVVPEAPAGEGAFVVQTSDGEL